MTQYMRIGEATITNTVLKVDNQIEVKDLRITFSINKKNKTDENRARIQIYNLSPESRKLCETEKDKLGAGQTHIELRVGYHSSESDDKPVVIFRGMCEVVNTFTTPTWVTEFRGLDGSSQYRSIIFEKTYPKGTKIQKIVDDLAKASGTTVFNRTPIEGVLGRARSLSGPAKNTIENLQSKYGFEFDIQDEETTVGGGSRKVYDKAHVFLSRSTGMIGEPQIKGGMVVVSCLLNPRIRPGASILLQSLKQNHLSGLYSCKKADIKGDTWGGDWSMVLELDGTGNGPDVYIDDPQTFSETSFA